MSERTIANGRIAANDTDIVRIFAISSLVVSCILITIVAFSANIDLLTTQLFYFPIIYAVYVFPRRGIIVAGICGIAYECIGYPFRYPDQVALLALTGQAVIFIIIAGIIAYLIERITDGEAQYRSVFECSQLAIVLFDRESFSIRGCNTKFSDMLRYTPNELSGITFPALLLTPPEDSRFLERIRSHEATENFETRLVTKDGARVWVNLSWCRINNHTVSCTAININARKLAEKAVNNNMMKYRQLTENSPTSILIIDNHEIRYSNPEFSRFLEYNSFETLGKNLITFVDPKDHEKFSECEAQWSQPRTKPVKTEFRFISKSGTLKEATLYSTSILHMEKPATLISLIDISDLTRLVEKIDFDNERRRGVIVTVAHELRTPLQPIMGYLNLLTQDPTGYGLNEETRKILERCLISVDRERQIINQMLDLAVLDSGKLQLSYSQFSPVSLVRSVLEASGYAAKAEIAIDIPENVTITADQDRLFIVLDSVLSNAVNYSKPPRKIDITYYSDSSDPCHHIAIKDNGIGIPEYSFSTIFQPFQLADAAKLARKYDRIGLSLSITKKIMELHGGNITVQSIVDKGSLFTLHLPKEVSRVP
jgi:PAS domain S-box-containing protein